MIKGMYVNVQDYGAKGDGITDDTAAIQAAIDDAYAKFGDPNPGSGGDLHGLYDQYIVCFPGGKYIIKDKITTHYGTVLQGVPGPVGGYNPGTNSWVSFGTWISVSDTKANGDTWTTTTLNNGHVYNGRACIDPDTTLVLQNINFYSENANANYSTWLYCGDTTDTGRILQFHCTGVRVLNFARGVYGSCFNDVFMQDTHFESVQVCFGSVYSPYSQNNWTVNIVNGVFTAMDIFIAMGKINNASMQISNCFVYGTNANTANFISQNAATSNYSQRIQFSNCKFWSGHFRSENNENVTYVTQYLFSNCVFDEGYWHSGNANSQYTKSSKFDNCVFNNFPFTYTNWEAGSSITNSMFEGTTTKITIDGGVSYIFNGNDFSAITYASEAPPIINYTGAGPGGTSSQIITSNIFRDVGDVGGTGIGSVTDLIIRSNTLVADN